jgi:uncharacterized oligopeptide transporter (OPT) family protein
MVFVGFGIALVHKFLTAACQLWSAEPAQQLYTVDKSGAKHGLKGAEVGGELSPELLGVGFLIGPRIASLMMAGAVLSYLILGPVIATFGERLDEPVPPAESNRVLAPKAEDVARMVGFGTQPGGGVPMSALAVATSEDKGLIRNMEPGALKANYLRYIGAGAVAAGGIISMLRALPLILASIVAGLRDLRASRAAGGEVATRTQRDLPMNVVLLGSLGLVLVLMLVPALGLGLNLEGFLGACMILLFGFLFVTVSSRLTGEVGSSSNPISGMTIATLLLTCLIFVLVGRTANRDPRILLTALMVAAVVCIASSNGGTTSQDLKTGFLVGATPRKQQWAILVGALTSALVIGVTMLLLNRAGTHYTTQGVADRRVEVPEGAPVERVGRPYEEDTAEYRVVFVRKDEYPADKASGLPEVKPGRYLAESDGQLKYLTVTPISPEAQELKKMDNNEDAPRPFTAPQPQLFASITDGILSGKLEWGLVIFGALIAVTLELAGVAALPFAVGMYIPLNSSAPIFVGGMLRWLADRFRGKSASDVETETSPGVLLSSGYIAGGTLCGLIIAFFEFAPPLKKAVNLGQHFGPAWTAPGAALPRILSLIAFGVLAGVLLWVGMRKSPVELDGPDEPPPRGGGGEYPPHLPGDERPV